jgi:hypothetical protein
MSIKSIVETPNPDALVMKPIKEQQDIYIPDIVDQNIPNRNGFIYITTGSGGSGKSSCMGNMFKSRNMYRGRFNNIYYFIPEASFLSADPKSNPFATHDKIYHELTPELLEEIYKELVGKKELATKEKPILKGAYADCEDPEEEEEHEIEYSCIIIDDFADALKDKGIQKQLNKMLIKARHICCAFIFTLQSYYYFPKILRKQLTNITIFKPKNYEEWATLAGELMNMNKEDALTLYNYVFNEKYTHLDIDTLTNTYYKNFNKLDFVQE